MAALETAHISELHRLAARAEVPRYRLLTREQLIGELRSRGVAPEEAAVPAGSSEPAAKDEPRERDRPGARRGSRADDGAGADDEPADEAETQPVSGILEVMPQRFGFLRLQGLEPADGDIYISASQIRRCELRSGDHVSGPAREPRRGERHRALVHVEAVNGVEPGGEQRDFEALTPVMPSRRIQLASGGGGDAELLLRAVDLLAPLAFGQRVLVSAAPRSGRTTLLRTLARAISSHEAAELIVLLVDERPEEATRWREELPDARLAIATAEVTGAEQSHLAELALAHARRLAESGADAVLLVDSLSRLAAGRRDVAAVKRLFGSGRELSEEGAGSLTVVATVLDGDADAAAVAVATTENSLVTLDAELAAAGVYPALDAANTRISNEEDLRDPAELEPARRLRSLLADLPPREAAAMLRERLEGSASNAELLGSL